MDAAEPRVRRRGYFLVTDPVESDSTDVEAPEGLSIRVRIVRRRLKKPMAVAASAAPVAIDPPSPSHRLQGLQSLQATAAAAVGVEFRLMSAIDTRPRARSRR